MVQRGAQICAMPFWRTATQKAWSKSAAPMASASADGRAQRWAETSGPKGPWSSCRCEGERRMFSLEEEEEGGMPRLMARWVRGAGLWVDRVERMEVERVERAAGEAEARMVGQGAVVKEPLGRRARGG